MTPASNSSLSGCKGRGGRISDESESGKGGEDIRAGKMKFGDAEGGLLVL